MLDACAGVAYTLDPSLLMEQAGLVPDPWQRDLLRSDARRVLVLAARQVGKSTAAAFVALAEALFRPRSLTLCVSPSQRQSAELFRKVAEGYRRVSDLAAVVGESALRIEFGNGSRVVSLPGSEGTVRGYSGVSLLLLDEAALIEDAMLAAVSPMLATTDGRLLALSTARLRQGFFWEAWRGEAEAWERVRVPVTECGRIREDFLRSERAQLGDAAFRAEYLCDFADEDGGAYFNPEAIARAFTPDVAPLVIL